VLRAFKCPYEAEESPAREGSRNTIEYDGIRLRVVIFGGSIGGLAAAISLRQAGAEVEVFERRDALIDEGAGLALGPLGLQGLSRMGIPLTTPVPLAWKYGSVRNGEARIRAERRLSAAHWYTYARLRKDLSDAAKGIPVHLQSAVTGVVSAARGARVQVEGIGNLDCDLVVAADGVDSKTRASFFPVVNPRAREVVLFRGFIPEDAARRVISPSGMKLFDQQNVQLFASSKEGGWLLCHLLPERIQGQGRMFQWILYVQASPKEQEEVLTDADGVLQRWATRADKTSNHAKARVKGILETNYPKEFAPLVGAGSFRVHRVAELIVPSMTEGRVVLLGDAAHIVPPFTGRGASLAIEDAISLTDALNESASVEEGLATWNTRRLLAVRGVLAMADAIQEHTLANPPDLAAGSDAAVRAWFEETFPSDSLGLLRLFERNAQLPLFG
jgi:2-polyprenyl-6-methoxyphenol hydroxylase-like FAD-dependent oxidoreductase